MLRMEFTIAAATLSMSVAAMPVFAQDADVFSVIEGEDRLSVLATALEAAGLSETLGTNGPFTVFAPSNDAFDALPEDALTDLLKPGNKDRLVAILTSHVAPHDAPAANLRDGMMGDTLSGARFKVFNDGKLVMFGEATVIEADLDASNGVVHIIDTVLMPE